MDRKSAPRGPRSLGEESSNQKRMRYGQVLSDLIDKTPLAIARFDRDGKCVFMNRGAKTITGRSFDYYIGKAFHNFSARSSELLNECERHFRKALETGQRCDSELSISQPTGLKRFLTTFFPELDGDGSVQHVVLLAVDISSHRAAQEMAREPDLRRDGFLPVLAHELRNPLATIRSGLRILGMARDGEQQEKVRQMMERQLSHVNRLVSDLLDVSRVSRGQLTIVKSKILLSDVITLALETSSYSIQKGRHTLAVSLPEVPIEVVGDSTRLSQVVSNLLDNASKYTPTGGAITLSVVCTKSRVEIRVADNGVGIPPEQLENVFKAFIQIEESRPRSRGGLGLGLFLVKKIVEAHNGEIKVESPVGNQKQGAAFTVILPLTENE